MLDDNPYEAPRPDSSDGPNPRSIGRALWMGAVFGVIVGLLSAGTLAIPLWALLRKTKAGDAGIALLPIVVGWILATTLACSLLLSGRVLLVKSRKPQDNGNEHPSDFAKHN